MIPQSPKKKMFGKLDSQCTEFRFVISYFGQRQHFTQDKMALTKWKTAKIIKYMQMM